MAAVQAAKRTKPEGAEPETTSFPEEEPIYSFPYELDPFQQRSIDALKAGDSVLVSAHTSAGKTTVALYGIAKALKEKKRVIYTSPIKALSNQKFREFSEKFESVGLMTGDTTIKPDSDCLVMTTEILRSMLYRGTEMLREVGCVIFDEVHYMRDKHRGVVWEETIIMLPEGCQYVFLSATIPNAQEFADWVQHIHPNTRCHVVHTDMRPVPLQHFLYPKGADGIFLVIDEASKFREDNFRKAMALLGGGEGSGPNGGDASSGGRLKGPGKRGSKEQQTKPIMNIVKLAMDKQMYPIIVFSFAKRECETNAMALAALDFNTDEESALVTEVFTNAMESLGEDDRKLPAVEHLLPLLKRGVGVHHSGLLPILKEVVELLFQAGLVKCLFSTETFSMGLNMPARTVIFTAVTKWDGEKQRLLTGGEYIQMSGRAGRRGLDRFGIVIAMIEEKTEPDQLRTLMSGGADTLHSSFHLTYNMVLNLMRVEDVDPEFMMTRSLFQFQRERNRPQLEARAAELEGQINTVPVDQLEVFEEFERSKRMLEEMEKQERAVKCAPKAIKGFLVPGRFVRVVRTADGADLGWGICAANAKSERRDADDNDGTAWSVEVCVVVMKLDPRAPAGSLPAPCAIPDYTSDVAELVTAAFPLTDIASVARFRSGMPANTHEEQHKVTIVKTLAKLYKTHGSNVPPLTAQELGIEDPKYGEVTKRIERLKKIVSSNELSNNPSPKLLADYERFQQRAALEAELNDVQEQLRNIRRTVLRDELKAMMRVLRRLDFIDRDTNVIQRKGRVACEITTDDESELLLTELLFRGTLNDMEPEMVCALLSCLVNVHKTPDGFSLPEEFQQPLTHLKSVVSRIASVSVECGLVATSGEAGSADAANLSDKVMPSLMEVTYRWAKGAKFIDVVGLTPAYEGDIVRMMRRLEELLRQMAGAARSPAIGSTEMYDKFMKGIEVIKRDIVFASSLYL